MLNEMKFTEMNENELLNVNGANAFTDACGACWDWCCDHKKEIGTALLIVGAVAVTGGVGLAGVAAAAAGGAVAAAAGTAGLGTALIVGGTAEFCAGLAICGGDDRKKAKAKK